MANEKKIIEIDIQLLDGLQNIEKLQTEIKKLTDANKELDRSNKNQAKQYAENTVLIRDYNKQLNVLIKETANAAKVSGQTMGYMQQLKAEVSNLTLQYERLSKAELEDAKVGGMVLNSLKTKREELAKLQQAYGNYSLQVGDYSKATNGLRLSVGMLAGELPNAGISMRTFVMSLSNNIQGLAQAITQARNENKLLKEQFEAGLSTQKPISLFKQLTSAIFSWQTMLMVGVALIVGYWDKIQDFFTKSTKAVENFTTAQSALNKVMQEGGGQAKQQISNVTELGVKIRKYGDDSKYSKDIIDEFNKTFDTHYKTIGEIRKVYPQLSKDFIDVAIKMAAANDLIAQSTTQTVRKLKAENILSTFSPQQIKGAEEQLDSFFNKIRENLRGEGLSENEIIKKVNNIANAIKNGNDLKGFWVDAGWNGFDEGLKDARMTIRKMYDDPIFISFFKDLGGKGGEALFKSILESRASNVQINNLKKEIEKLYTLDFSLKDTPTGNGGKNVKDKIKEMFDYEGELRELTAKQETDDFKKRLAEIEKYYGDKKDIYEKALKEETLTKEQYYKLMLELGVAVQKQQIDAYDDYLKKIAKTAQDAIDKANSDWNKFRNNQKENILIVSKTELQKQQQDYNLAVFKNTDDLNDAKKLRQAEYWTDIAELDKQNLDKNSKEYQLAKKSIDDKYYLIGLQDEKYYLDKKTELYFNYANTVSGILNSMSDFVTALSERELQSYAKTIQGKANYDELYARKKAEIERKNAVLNRSVASFGTIVNTAEAIMKAMTTDPTGVLAVLTGIQGAIQLATIWAQPLPSYEGGSGSQSKSTTQVTEKFHTGGVGDSPDSVKRSDEITKTLLLSERILSPVQTSIFDSMINKVQSYGGSGSITNGVGVNDYLQESMLVRAFSKALINQKPQQISWSEFSNQAQRQQQLQNNLFVR